ncbi:MAG: hypothetical protein JOZ11_09360 [Alphaproteobacteria bacterium]|nr:hypothetical protein [Alphaproteobacteria bacterium]
MSSRAAVLSRRKEAVLAGNRKFSEKLIIIGAGAAGRELAGVIADINDRKPTWKLIGLLDDDSGLQLVRLPDALHRAQ